MSLSTRLDIQSFNCDMVYSQPYLGIVDSKKSRKERLFINTTKKIDKKNFSKNLAILAQLQIRER